jgi:hypothetical protein
VIAADIVAPPIGRRRAGPIGIFVLGFRQQPIGVAGARGNPGNIGLSIKPIDADRGIRGRLRLARTPPATLSALIVPFAALKGLAGVAHVISGGDNEARKFCDRDRIFTDCQRVIDPDPVAGAFIGAPMRFGRRGAHGEFAGRDDNKFR